MVAAAITSAKDEPVKPPPAREPPPLASATLAPELVAAAERDGIPLQGGTQDGREPQTGDAVVVWIGTRDPKKTRQWLVQLQRAVATEAEQQSWRGRVKTMYLSWGPVVTFETTVEALEVWVAGPVEVSSPAASTESTARRPPAPVQRERVTVPADYLRLGLDDSARAVVRLIEHTQRAKDEGRTLAMESLYGREWPIPPEQMGPSQALVAELGFTPTDGRAWAGGYVALRTFLEAIQSVPSLREIADTALAKPGALKLSQAALTGNASFNTNIGNARAVHPAEFGLMPVNSDAFYFDFSMQFAGTPVVEGAMIVTAPVAPLDVSAGILGLVAGHPKDPHRVIQLSLIGSHGAAAPADPVATAVGAAAARK